LGRIDGVSKDAKPFGETLDLIEQQRRTLLEAGKSFARGALYHLLRNRIYLGEVVHKGVSYPGEHERIVDDELWRPVQAKLDTNHGARRKSRIESSAVLGGLIYDDRGNLMSPAYSVRRGNRYRYYVGRALVRRRKEDSGSHGRVRADDIERQVVELLGREFSRPGLSEDVSAGTWSIETRSLVQEVDLEIDTLDRGCWHAIARSECFAQLFSLNESDA
jgi:transposase